MKTKWGYFILIIFLFFVSCRQEQNSIPNSSAQLSTPPQPFYKHLKGKYFDMEADLNLTVIDSSVQFTLVYYPSYNVISDVVDFLNGGFNYRIVSKYDTLEKWFVHWNNDTSVVLKVKSPLRDTTYLFWEDYSNSAKLEVAEVDTTVLDPRTKKEAINIRLTSVYFNNDNPSFLLDKDALIHTRDSIITNAMKKVLSYSSDQIEQMFFPFNYDLLSNVEYNDNGLLVISYNYFSYTGGSHGYNSLKFYNIDLENKQLLHLSDIMNVTGLKQMIYEKLLQKNIVLFVDEKTIYIPENFYIKGRKIYFVYNTYEIAPYSEGSISVSFDFREIKDRLKPEFIKKFYPKIKL